MKLFEAQFRSRRVGGEWLFSARVIYGRRWRVWRVLDAASLTAAQIEVSEWSRRHGKSALLEWDYVRVSPRSAPEAQLQFALSARKKARAFGAGLLGPTL